ncbi:hypothetical protein EU528_08820 [Candidatus Thorarchaeota archaeon]|nr:MAG: hypothetical protein EU528_08820 [Candidatus Thorarchaeota archaeon]
MIEEPKNAFDEIASDPNFLMILAGAVIWFIGYYVGLLNPLFRSTGFVLVCFSAALTSLKRPVALAWPGLLLGGLLQIIGYYLEWVLILGPALIVTGGVMVVYFAIPLALQRGELPVITRLQKLIESKKKDEEIQDIKAEEPVKETDVTEDEDSANNY